MYNLKVILVISLLSIFVHAKLELCNLMSFEQNWIEHLITNKFSFYRAIGAPADVIELIKKKKARNSMYIKSITDGFNIQFSEYSVEKSDIEYLNGKKQPVTQIQLINGKQATLNHTCQGHHYIATYKISKTQVIFVERMVISGQMVVQYRYTNNRKRTNYRTVYKIKL